MWSRHCDNKPPSIDEGGDLNGITDHRCQAASGGNGSARRSQRDGLRIKVKKSGEMEAEFRIVHRGGSSIGDLLVFLFARRKRPPNFRSAPKRPGTLCPLVCAMPRSERPALSKRPSETGWLILPAIAAERRGGNGRKCAEDNIERPGHYASVSKSSQRG